MNRIVFAPAAALLCVALTAPSLSAQAAKPSTQAPVAKAAPTTATPAPAAPAKFFKPVKGVATVDYFIVSGPKKAGSDIVTVIKVKNTSAGAISLFKIDEYLYDKAPKIVSGDTQAWRKPFNPGDIVELTLKSPWKPDFYRNQYQFSHANGEIKPTKVTKKF